MGAVILSPEDQLALRNSAKQELERLEQLMENSETIQLLDEFKNRFNICETVYKVILKKHQECRRKKSETYLKVTMTQVPYALEFAGYSFSHDLLSELFGATSHKGRTVKKLRDAVTHGVDPKAVNEIITRKDELFGYMDSFLLEIRSYDNAAA